MIIKDSKLLLLALSLIIGLGACKDGKLPKAEHFKDDKVHEIRFKFEYETFWDTLLDYKAYREENHESKYALAAMTINTSHYDSIGVRLKGESSYDFYKSDKKSLKIDMNLFVPGQKHEGSRKFNLINCFKDPSHLREKLYLDELKDNKLPAPRASYARVYINDEFWGLYLLVEQIDKHFVKDFFGDRKGNLYKGEPNGKLKYYEDDIKKYQRSYKLKHDGFATPYVDLMHFTKVINQEYISEAAFVSALEDVLETEDLLTAWAINSWMVNIDAYNMRYPHNFYLYNDSASGKFNWISFDGNYAFAAWSPEFNLQESIELDIFWVHDKESMPLLSKMFETKHYRVMYANIMSDLVKGFSSRKFSRRCETLGLMISGDLAKDKKKMFETSTTMQNIKNHLGDTGDPGAFTPGVVPFMEARTKNVMKQLQKLGYEF